MDVDSSPAPVHAGRGCIPRAAAAAGLLLLAFAFLLIARVAPVRAAVFNPIADTYSRSDCKSCNYGTDTTLREDLLSSNGISYSYLMFNLQGLQAPVANATLRLYGIPTSDSSNTSSQPVQIYSVANNSWTQAGLTWNNQPAMGSLLTTSPSFANNSWVSIPIPSPASELPGNGLVSMGIKSTDPNLARKEASTNDTAHNYPQLVVPPTVTLTSPNAAWTNNPTPTFSGAAGTASTATTGVVSADQPTVTVNIYSGSAASGTPVQALTTTQSGGAWSASAAHLADGTYTAQATQSDAAGNVGTSSSYTFTVDTVPPAVTLTTPANQGWVNSSTPTFSGAAGNAAGDGPTVSVNIWSASQYPNGAPVQTLTTSRTGNAWTAVASAALPDGSYVVQATQSDAAGNTGTSTPATTFTVDTTPPAVSASAPVAGAWLNNNTPTFTGAGGTANGDNANVTVSVYTGSSASGTPVQTLTAPVSNGAWSVPASSALSDGTYTFQASQSDAAGNVGKTSPITFHVKATPPALTLTSPSAGTTTGPEPTLSGAAGSAPGDSGTVSVSLYSGASATGTPAQTLTASVSNGTWSVLPSTALTTGTYTVQASQSDAAGNVTTTQADTFTVDATPPSVTLSAPANGTTTNANQPTFSGSAGTASGDLPTVTVTIYAGSAATGTPVQTLTTTQSAGSWSVQASSVLSDGTYTAQASQVDQVGNVGTSASSTFTIDTTPPKVTLTTPANGSSVNTSTPSLGGAAGTAPGDSSAVTVNIYGGQGTSGQLVQQLTAVAYAGTWVASPSPGLSDGTYTAQATQLDEVNNVGTSQAVTFTIDTVPPAVTLSQPANGSTTNVTPTFSGTAGTAPGDFGQVAVNLYAGTTPSGTPVQTLTATASNGTWSVTAQPVPTGQYTAQAVQSDAAGNVGTSQPTTFTAAGIGVSLNQPANGSVLGTSTPTFSGQATDTSSSLPTVTVNIYSGATISGSPVTTLTTTESGGSWSVVPQTPLPDGEYTAQATQSDTSGNLGVSAAQTFTISTAPPAPTVTSPTNGAWLNTSTPTLSGTAQTGSADQPSVSVSIYSGQTASGTPVQTLSANASSGSWSVTPQSLPDGPYTVTVSQSNVGGTVGTSPGTTFTVDTTPPAVTLTSPTGSTNVNKPTFSGAAGTAPGDLPTVTVQVFSGSSATGTPVQTLSTTASGGAWSVAAGSTLPDGTYTAKVTQSDQAGNVGSSTQTFTVDTTPPAVSLTAPANNSVIANGTPTFSGAAGTASGDGSTITVNVYPGNTATGTAVETLTATASGSSWSVAATPKLSDGTYTAQATQSDAAGNIGQSSATFTVDTTPPAVTATSPTGYTNQTTPTFSGTAGTATGDQPAITVQVFSGSSATGTPVQTLSTTASGGTWSVPASGALAQGTYTAQASQTDWAGNVGRSSTTFTVDTTAPAVTLTSPTGTTNNNKPTFSGAAGTAPGDQSTVNVQVFSGSSATGTPVQILSATASGSSWSVTASSSLTDGTYTAKATQQDAAGNTSSSAQTFTVDTTPPNVSVTSPGAGSTVAASAPISGSGGTAPGDQSTVAVTVYPGTSASGTPFESFSPVSVGSNGTWSVTPANVFGEGQYTIQATQSDAAGNVGTSTVTFTSNAPVVDAAGDIACDPTDSNFNGGNGNASGCQEKATAALLTGADRILPLGDTQYDSATTAAYQQVYNPTWGAFKSITDPTIGNHEYDSPDGVAKPYFSYFGAAAGNPSLGYYSTNIGNWHVISLNSNCSAVGGCQAGSAQEVWLKNDLANDHANCTMALWHAPRWSSASDQSDTTYQPFWQDLYNQGADLVLVGHMHNYERFAPQTATGVLDQAKGIPEIVVGDGGRALVPFTSVLPNSVVRNASTFGVLQLTLHANSYNFKFLPIAGSTFTDSGSATCHH